MQVPQDLLHLFTDMPFAIIPRQRPSSLDQYIHALEYQIYPMIRLIPKSICISSPVTDRFSFLFWRAYKLVLYTISSMRSAGNKCLKKSVGSLPSTLLPVGLFQFRRIDRYAHSGQRGGWLLVILDSEEIYLQLHRLTTELTSMDYGSRERSRG